MDLVVYAEGGGESDQLRSEMRQAFSVFFDNAGLSKQKPHVVSCGSRENAFRDFRLAISQGKNALLLVDSETPVLAEHGEDGEFLPWLHLKKKKQDKQKQDNWNKPAGAANEDCHLMVQCMESWFVADWQVVSEFFGQGFKDNSKPTQMIEQIPKAELFNALEKATKDCKKGKYGKASHSFKLLALISPNRVIEASPWAKRFIEEIIKRKSVQ